MELTTLSSIELKRLEIIQSIIEKRLSVVEAGNQLDLSRSQVHGLLKRYITRCVQPDWFLANAESRLTCPPGSASFVRRVRHWAGDG